jgi:2-keto-4-pentenoate hydratase/2-oxohepta-3-ene-1,7-dioic acid hydratase in catechol pathway
LLGYTIGNDISARDAGKQLKVLDVFTQKALDRTAPVGPWITTLDEFGGPGQPQVDMVLRVNGEVRQRDNTSSMIFPIDEILNFIDARISLRAGDMIFTGSTAGVGLEDGRFLQPGDLLEGTIERIGVLSNRIDVKHGLSPARGVGRLGIGA